jgi:hypothetical protein
MHQVLKFFAAGAGVLNDPAVEGDHGTFTGGGGLVQAHGRRGPVSNQLFQALRNLVDSKPDTVQGLSPDVMQTLGGVHDHLVEAVGTGAVAGQRGQHQFTAQAAAMAVPAALPEALPADRY